MCIEALNWAWQIEGLTPTRKLVLLKIADYSDPITKRAYPSNSHIAKKVGLKDPKSVQKIIKELEELGLIKRIPRYKDDKKGQTSNWIECLLPVGSQDTPPPRSVTPLPTATAHPNTLEDTKEETKRNTKEKKAKELLFSIKGIYQENFPTHKEKKVSAEHQHLILSLLKKPPEFEDDGKLEKQPVGDLEWWEEYFAFCALSEELKTGWQFEDRNKIPDLEFLLRRRTMGKVFNLDYHPQLKGATR